MNLIRTSKHLARLVLVMYFFCVGTAIASPLIAPKSVQLICSSAGMVKLIVTSEDGTQVNDKPMLDCPLCVAIGPAPSFASTAVPNLQPVSYLLQRIPAARIAAITAAPLPARGPPYNS